MTRLAKGNGQKQALKSSSVEVKFLTLAFCFYFSILVILKVLRYFLVIFEVLEYFSSFKRYQGIFAHFRGFGGYVAFNHAIGN